MGNGTREAFRNWLSGKGLSHTKYKTLPPENRKALYLEYQRKGRRHETMDSRGK